MNEQRRPPWTPRSLPAPDVLVWEPPKPFALTGVECDEIVRAAELPGLLVGERTSSYNVEALGITRVMEQLEGINAATWRLPFDGFTNSVYGWGPGNWMAEHTDYNPAFGDEYPCIPFAASVQLSGPDEYVGGDLFLADGRVVPKARGTVVVWPCTTPHGVRTVVSGARISLVVFAIFGTNATARTEGWPERWL